MPLILLVVPKSEKLFITHFWSCANIREFWAQVSHLIFKVTDILKGCWDFPPPFNHNVVKCCIYSLPIHLLNAAKACVPIICKQTVTSLVSLGFSKISNVVLLEFTFYPEYRDIVGSQSQNLWDVCSSLNGLLMLMDVPWCASLRLYTFFHLNPFLFL